MTPEVVKTELIEDYIALVTIDNPPVNAHSGQVLEKWHGLSMPSVIVKMCVSRY